jgi:uncharacterized protein (TIGR04255 family)
MNDAWGQYHHSPFLTVSCRLQFPPILTINRELPTTFQERLRKDFPLFQPTQDRLGYRFGSQDGAHEIQLTSESLGISTTRFPSWQDFQARVTTAVDALRTTYEPAFCTRASLRFQVLLRPIRYGLTKIQWASLINAKVLGPFSLPGQKGQLQGSRHEVVVTLPPSSNRFRLVHGFVEVREPGHANRPGEPAYLLDQDYFTTQRIEWTTVMAILDQFEQEAGQFFRLCVSDHLRQAMMEKAA